VTKLGRLFEVPLEQVSLLAADEEISAQIDLLQSADVIELNELDWGMKRTDYQAVVKELANALKMNWAYGVEFIEVDPKVLGLQSFANVKNETERKELETLFSVDKDRVLGMHGTAIRYTHSCMSDGGDRPKGVSKHSTVAGETGMTPQATAWLWFPHVPMSRPFWRAQFLSR
jgi:hypothetical protein